MTSLTGRWIPKTDMGRKWHCKTLSSHFGFRGRVKSKLLRFRNAEESNLKGFMPFSINCARYSDQAEPVYNEVIKATADGNWVDYVWQEKQKHTYVRKTKGGLIVGSGYSE